MADFVYENPTLVFVIFIYALLLLIWISAASVEKMSWKFAKRSFLVCTAASLLVILSADIRRGNDEKIIAREEISEIVPDPTPYNINTQREREEQEEPNEDEWIPEFDFIMTPDSTAFSRIGYCEDLWELMLTFRTTGDYVYHGVPPEIWEGLVAAESRGGYFQQNIKGNYDYERLD